MRFGAGLNTSYFFKSKDVVNQEIGSVLEDWAAQNNDAVLSNFDHLLECFCVYGNEYASIEAERNSDDDADGLTGAQRAASMEAENKELRGVLKQFVAENIRPEASLDETADGLNLDDQSTNRFDAIQRLYDNANYQDIPAYKLFSGAVDIMTKMRESSTTTRTVTNDILFPGMKMFTDLDGDGVSDIGDVLAPFVSSDKGIVFDISRFTDASISAASDTEETRAFYSLSKEDMKALLEPLSCNDNMVATERAEFLCVAQALSNCEKYRFNKAKTADEEDKERERKEDEDSQRAYMKSKQDEQDRKALAEKAAQEAAARRKQSEKSK